MIRFKANGDDHESPEPVSVSLFLENIKLNPGRVIVEYNKEFLAGADFQKTVIHDGDVLEIIRAFAGG